MWLAKAHIEKKEGSNGLVAVAVDRDKGSPNALKWAVDNLLHHGQSIILVHVKIKSSFSSSSSLSAPRVHRSSDVCDGSASDPHTQSLLLPFRCFCTRKDVECRDIVLEDTDVAKALVDFVSWASIENLVVGATTKNGFFRRFKMADIPASVVKYAPAFCNVYVINKGKVSIPHAASRPVPSISPFHAQSPSPAVKYEVDEQCPRYSLRSKASSAPEIQEAESGIGTNRDMEFLRSPLDHRSDISRKSYGDFSFLDMDLSFVGSRPPDHMLSPFRDIMDPSRTPPRLSGFSDIDSPVIDLGHRFLDSNSPSGSTSSFHDVDHMSCSSQPMEDMEVEMRRLKLELKQTMDMYSTACKEALMAKQKAMELQRWKVEEERQAEREKARSRAALEHAEVAQRIAEIEAQKRITAEMNATREAEEKEKALSALAHSDVRYRRYTIEEIETATTFFSDKCKIGEGGYGPVFKCRLDHTEVAVKVLRPDATQGPSQFQQEVEVLSCIRHPNMVLLLGACPGSGCLVYEFMANGSLEDRLFPHGSSTSPLSWQLRCRIMAEIGTALLFLHQTKPEPIVHRDLKPANILLDRNFVSKISDVGLSRLVPPSSGDDVTRYRMTSAAGTFCYIDPEYQQTGMLGVKSDVYSFGVVMLQMLTARPPMGLTHQVERALERGMLLEMLDPTVPDWPLDTALGLAKMALGCTELRRKDRPDLANFVLPELNRIRAIAEATHDRLILPVRHD